MEVGLEGYLVEGLSKVGDHYYLTSINKREVLKLDAKGNAAVIADKSDGLLGAMDIVVSPEGGRLWFTSSGLDQVERLTEEEKGTSRLHSYDFDAQKVLKTYTIEGQHNFGSIAFSPDKKLYLSDTTTNSLFVLDEKTEKIEHVVNIPDAGSIQWLAFDGIGNLYVADYSTGFYKINISNKSYQRLRAPVGSTLLAVDGLYYFEGSLIAIQNGVNPFRVIKVNLDGNGNEVLTVKVLDGAHPDFVEPTNGHLYKNSLIFTGNSGWKAFGNPNLTEEERTKILVNPKVYSISLN